MSSDEDPEQSRSPEKGKPAAIATLLRIAKWLIVIAVAVGIYFAAQAALSQWESETSQLKSEIASIELAMNESESESEREALRRQRDRLDASIPRIENLRWDRLALASLLYGLGLIPPAFLLRRAVGSLGHRAPVSTAIAAQLLGHVGKYVPGKAMVVVLRAATLARAGVRPLAATVSVFLETFLMMAVGAAVAGLVVWWLPVPRWIALSSILVACLASLPTLPPVLKLVAARVTKSNLVSTESTIGFGLFAAGWGWSLLSWVFIGASFTTLITAIPSVTPLPGWLELYPIATAAISLAIVIGFASLLPGGAGIRELVITTVLGVSIGSVQGILAAIAARVMFIFVEAVVAAVSWLWLRKRYAHNS